METSRYSEPMYLHYFTQEKEFPFFIQDGHHDKIFKWHHHNDFVELIIVLEGTATHQVNDSTYFIKRGDVFALADGVSHNFVDASRLHICNIMFRIQDLINHCPDLKTIPGFHALFVIEPYLTQNHEFQSYLTLDFQQFDQIKQLIEMIFKEYYSDNAGRKTVVLSLFQILVTLLSRCYELPTDQTQFSGSFRLANTISYMEEHFREEQSIQQLAEISHLSPRHFTRLFAATYHTTPKNYITQLRLSHACRLLESSDKALSITEIAYDAGFQNNNYFTRLFRQTYGITPREYRSEHAFNNFL